MIERPIVLTFVANYLPGYKAGGPLRTIVNMVDHLSDEFEFWIITTDRDLGDTAPYLNIKIEQWQEVGLAMVFYASPTNYTIKRIASIITDTTHHILYLNSFFDLNFTIKPLLGRKLRLFPAKPLIIAPRGEFSDGAIKIKFLKKYIYVQIIKVFRMYNNVCWQASSRHEKNDIQKYIGYLTKIFVAPDLSGLRKSDTKIAQTVEFSNHHTDSLRMIFLSRISPKKNLDYALKVLSKVKVSVTFDIYGPIEESAYWETCKKWIELLPINVKVNYLGSVHPDEVSTLFSRYDIFFFPTRGENYGHVIAEALSVGTAVLLSDRTPWTDLERDKMGWNVPLENNIRFVNIIDNFSTLVGKDGWECRNHIKRKVSERLADPEIIELNRNLFKDMLQNSLNP